MRRREFIAGLGGAAAWPLAARAQQPAKPVIGFVNVGSTDTAAGTLAAFRKGLVVTGYVEGRDVGIEYRLAEGEYGRLVTLATDLVRRRVDVIFATGTTAALAAKSATTSIPVVFVIGTDPIKSGLVASLNRPGGNVTGLTDFANQLVGKRVDLMHSSVPSARIIALLINSANPVAADTTDMQLAAAARGLELHVINAGNESELETAFKTMVQLRVGALFVKSLIFERDKMITKLAARYSLPTIYTLREFVKAGGLMSYGADRSETAREAGIYVGRILKGEKPGELPVQQPTKFELVINMQTAKALGIELPQIVVALADEVIE